MNPAINDRIAQIKAGQVPEGYKKIKSSIIPLDWDFVKVKNVLQRIRNAVDVQPDSQYRQIGIRSHGKGIFYKDAVTGAKLEKKAVFWIESDCFIVNIVFAWEMAVAKTTVNEIGMIASHRFPMYKVVKNKLDLDYITYFFKSPLGKELLGLASPGGAGRNKTLGQHEFSELEIPMPKSISEQQKIAEILTIWDKGIELKQKLIAEKKAQKKWLMQQLLTGEIRLSGFSGCWKTMKLGDVFSFEGGISVSRNDLSRNGYCYLHYGDIHKVSKYFIDMEKEFDNIPKLSIDIDEIPEKKLLKNGDVVFVDASEDYDGTTKYVVVKNKKNIPFIAGLHTIVAKSNGNLIDNAYKIFCFQNQTVKVQFAFYATGMSIYGLSKTNIAKIKIQLPSLHEQTAIAEILSTADQEVELLEKELTELTQQKKGLIQLLLTGIVRVNKPMANC